MSATMRLKEIVRKLLKEEYFRQRNNQIHLFEMATICVAKWGKDTYSVQIHGASTTNRDIPHIHIYKKIDKNKKQFNFEISIIDLLTKDEIVIIRQLDKSHNVNVKNKVDCSWVGYKELLEGFREFLFGKPISSIYNNLGLYDNLDVAIYE